MSPCLQPLTTGSVLQICGFFSVRFRNCIFYTRNYFVVYYKKKVKFWTFLNSFGIIKQLLLLYEVKINLSTLEKLFSLDLTPSGKLPPKIWQLSMLTSYEGNNCMMTNGKRYRRKSVSSLDMKGMMKSVDMKGMMISVDMNGMMKSVLVISISSDQSSTISMKVSQLYQQCLRILCKTIIIFQWSKMWNRYFLYLYYV